MSENQRPDPSERSYINGDGDLLLLRTFTPYFQRRCRELINDGCISGVMKNDELCIRYSEIINYTAPDYDLQLPRPDR